MTSSHTTSPAQLYFLALSPPLPGPHPIDLPTQLAKISTRPKDALTSHASASTSVWVVVGIIPSLSAKQRDPPLTDYMVSLPLVVYRSLINPLIHISRSTLLSNPYRRSPIGTSPSHIVTSRSFLIRIRRIRHSSPIGICRSSPIGISRSSPIGTIRSSPIGISHSSPIGTIHSSPIGISRICHSSPIGIIHLSPIGTSQKPSF